MAPTAKPPKHATPGFERYAWLVLVPIAILAAFSFISLQRDQRMAQQDATERAQQLANDILDRIWLELSYERHRPDFKGVTFTVDNAGTLISPKPIPDAVPQPLEASALNSNQQA